MLFFGFQFLAAAEKDSLSGNPFTPMRMAFDCDACGCSASGGSMGFSSMLDEHFVGVRYLYQKYTSRDGIFANSPWVEEHFNTAQLWARIPVSRKIQLMALLPYHFHNRELSSGNQKIEGLGDMTLMGFYTLYKTQKDSVAWRHTIQLGSGIKAPTGKYRESANAGSVNPSFQVGTGSWDYLFAAEYALEYRSWGLNLLGNYVVKTENDKAYRFGNQFNYGATAYYKLSRKTVMLVPQGGLAGEVYAPNYQHGQRLADTSGEVLFGKIGLEAGKGRFSAGLQYMTPIAQQLSGGNVKAGYRFSLNLNYSL